MLFCSAEYALFFSAVFVAYWSMPSRAARFLLLALAGPYLGYETWKHVADVHASGWLAYAEALGTSFAAAGILYWVAGIVLVGTALAFRLGHDRGRVWMLLLASFFFYASWNKWLATLIFVTTGMDYVIARGMHASASTLWRRLLLVVSLVVNLGLLAYFKYSNFFLQSLQQSLQAAGVHTSMPVLQVILPIGISFYTFEAINYTVDVYRRRVVPERNLANFILFITFFPHLVAGPIVRARDFLPQIGRRKHWDWARLELGARFFLMGLFKKWAIADRMALYSDPVFADPRHFSSSACWLAVIAYALQIYGDFSGYSDMALGSAHMLGYKLAQNFNMPYLATNLSEFWHRWHMSLSTWLRDYLFIPLGGSRCSRWRTCLNLMITMTLGGLWHGANWTFVVWGAAHGGLLVVHRFFRDFCKPRPWLDKLLQGAPGRVLCGAATFLAVSLCWVLFRAQDVMIPNTHRVILTGWQVAAAMFHRLFVPHHGMGAPLHNRGLWYTVAVVVVCHALAYSGVWKRMAVRLPAPVLGFGYAVVLTLAMVLAPDAGKAFIYFQF
ncbi:MAG TPA: MBOAT family O-acyltransferase [Gemmataceae bacterium]|nr:MBOAT family O-acyltransferase [Gemmataceae bacterium]